MIPCLKIDVNTCPECSAPMDGIPYMGCCDDIFEDKKGIREAF